MQYFPNSNTPRIKQNLEPYRLIKLDRHGTTYAEYVEQRKFASYMREREKNKYFGCTPWEWVLMLLYHFVFYICMALLCLICYVVFRFCFLDENMPSEFQTQPQVGILPVPNREDNVFVFRDSVDDATEGILSRVHDLLKKYGPIDDRFGPCQVSTDYGFLENSPCIFLKVNRILGWKLDPYESENDLPSSAPLDLRDHIQLLQPEERKGRLWVSCDYSVESKMKIPVQYYPSSRSIPRSALERAPNKNPDKFFSKEDYDRIVAVQFSNVPLREMIDIRCQIWAKNVRIDDDPSTEIGGATLKTILDKD